MTMTDKPKNVFQIGDHNRVANVHVGDVNIDRRVRRTLGEDLKAGLLQMSKDRPVTVLGLNGNTESMAFANQIHDFLAASGYQMTGSHATWHMFFDPPVYTVNISPFNNGSEWHVVVGPAE